MQHNALWPLCTFQLPAVEPLMSELISTEVLHNLESVPMGAMLANGALGC